MAENRPHEFVMEFVANSQRYKEQYVARWIESIHNFTVEPQWDTFRKEVSPYRSGPVYRPSRHQVILKDPETHKAIMTLASKLTRSVFGDPRREYIKARPRGYEDAPNKAPTVSRLLRYAFSLPGHYRTMVEAIIDMLIFGTSIVEITWMYQEREMVVRDVVEQLGVVYDEQTRMRVPVYDDVKINVVDVQDFYPDPSRYRLSDMPGVAKRFRMNALDARRMANEGIYKASAVDMAVESLSQSRTRNDVERDDDFREGIDQPTDTYTHSDFADMIGYEYWGEVPWDDDGSSRRVITVLNDEVVRDDPYPYADPALPFHSLMINPVQGRFYGLSPAEIIRYDQDFADAVKILLAEAIIRQVHPPLVFDQDSDVDVAKLKAWKADVPIRARGGIKSVGTLQYNADIGAGFAMLNGLKGSMQDATGSTPPLSGDPGPSREAATVGTLRYQAAMDRPDLAAALIENDALPPIGNAVLRRYQQFLLDTEDLKARIGELPEPAWIGDIMGEFDVEFVGSRMDMTRQQRLQAYDRLVALANAVPPFAAMIPWNELAVRLIGEELELPEVAALLPQLNQQQQLLLNLMLSGGGRGTASNGNNQAMTSEPAGMLPAQVAGNVG